MKLLRHGMPMLRSSLGRIEHAASAQVVERLRGKALQLMRRRILVRDGYLCQCPWCQAGGNPLPITMSTFELDHVQPLHMGGTNAMTNMRALHRDCHARITDEQRRAGWAMDGGGLGGGGPVHSSTRSR